MRVSKTRIRLYSKRSVNVLLCYSHYIYWNYLCFSCIWQPGIYFAWQQLFC